MEAKDLNKKLKRAQENSREADRKLTKIYLKIAEFVSSSRVYDVVLGQEGCEKSFDPAHPDWRKRIRGAKQVFVFNDVKYDDESDAGNTSKEMLEKAEGVKALIYRADAKFNPVVIFFGFCDQCFKKEYKEGQKAAQELSKRDDIIVRFTGLDPL